MKRPPYGIQRLPPYGLCLPVHHRECVGWNAISVSLPLSDWTLRVELPLESAAPATARKALEACLVAAESLTVFVPGIVRPETCEEKDWITVCGEVFLGRGISVSDAMVGAGVATRLPTSPRLAKAPPFGFCSPVHYHRCRDGDTVEVCLPQSDRVWAIRLIDCWCREMHEPGGIEAKQYAEKVLEQVDHLSVFIPAPRDVHNLLANLTFDRIPGYLFVSCDRTLNEMMVAAGHATKTKEPA